MDSLIGWGFFFCFFILLVALDKKYRKKGKTGEFKRKNYRNDYFDSNFDSLDRSRKFFDQQTNDMINSPSYSYLSGNIYHKK